MATLSTRLAAIGLAASLTACVAGPPPEVATTTPQLPEVYTLAVDAQDAASVDALLPSEDAGFVALSTTALEKAPSLLEAIARIEAARAGARRAGAERLPNIGADASVTENRINPNQFGSNNPFAQAIDTTQVSYGANITARWDADLFGQLKAQERAAIARIDAASAAASAVRLALLSEIAASVVDWRALDARTTAIESDVAAATRLAALAKTREDAGIAPGFDRVRAQAQASASRSRLAALKSERARLLGRLVTLTSMNGAEVAAALSLPTNSPDLGSAPASLPSQLLANRPDVLAAAAELAASDAELAATARARFPRLTLSGVIGLLSFSPGDFFDEDSLVRTLTAGVAAPLLDFGRIEAEIDGAAASKKVAFQAYRGAVFQALGDAEAAYGLVAAADEQAALATQERDELERAANLADDRYRAGLASFLEVLEARRAADSSGERAAVAVAAAQRARIILWQALGGDASTASNDPA
ncbi:TolC family protein [Erythrobacter sp. SCSIO 43205]|uniref:efflux transporter outer membrane subunit n=1 Tax=Erythrobacter sp. SCSIO 43205 TaxID=2779361 RepID=UPI001CA94ED1|nr:TolC family protein [Erythrobacter sp. SCSIO 43205]UAB78226.1 TolC family protein [Erythrobacter sp. SCSIO 43205]